MTKRPTRCYSYVYPMIIYKLFPKDFLISKRQERCEIIRCHPRFLVPSGSWLPPPPPPPSLTNNSTFAILQFINPSLIPFLFHETNVQYLLVCALSMCLPVGLGALALARVYYSHITFLFSGSINSPFRVLPARILFYKGKCEQI